MDHKLAKLPILPFADPKTLTWPKMSIRVRLGFWLSEDFNTIFNTVFRITFTVDLDIVENDRVRSDTIQDNVIDLGAQSIVTTPYGI